MRLFQLSWVIYAFNLLDDEREHIQNCSDWDKEVANVAILLNDFKTAIYGLELQKNLKETAGRIDLLKSKLQLVIEKGFSSTNITPSELTCPHQLEGFQ